jgi:hypothetical protein
MTIHRPWCPLLGGGECACRDIRDERTLEMFPVEPKQDESEAPAQEEEPS